MLLPSGTQVVRLVHDYHGKIVKRTGSLPKAQEFRESDPGLTSTSGANCPGGVQAGTRHQPLFDFPDGHDLDLLVDRRGRMGGILQLLFAETDRLDALGRNLERGHQHVADRIGPPLA
jgi:hypothetical protein